MWNVFVEYITRDSIHLTLFICLIALSVIGFCEIIFQIWNCFYKAKIANDFMHHIDIIAAHVHKRLEKEKTEWGSKYDYTDLREISDSLYYVEVNHQEVEQSIESDDIPIYRLYYMLYNRNWNDDDANRYCHQIYVDYDISQRKLGKTAERNIIYLFIPFTKLYRGFCVLFRILTYPIRWFMARHQRSFDSSGKLESFISTSAEIATIIGVIYELSKAAL
jgi:hypothetical protein